MKLPEPPKPIETWCLACNAHMPGESPEVAFCDTCVNLSHFERTALVHLNEITVRLSDMAQDVHCLHHALHPGMDEDEGKEKTKETWH
jgi:hypothetical protein